MYHNFFHRHYNESAYKLPKKSGVRWQFNDWESLIKRHFFFAALQVPKLLQYMNSPPTFSVLTFTLVLTYSNCIAYISMRVKKAMDECV